MRLREEEGAWGGFPARGMSLREGWGREKHGKPARAPAPGWRRCPLGWVRREPAGAGEGVKFASVQRDREKWTVAQSKEMVSPEHSVPVGMHLSELLQGM